MEGTLLAWSAPVWSINPVCGRFPPTQLFGIDQSNSFFASSAPLLILTVLYYLDSPALLLAFIFCYFHANCFPDHANCMPSPFLWSSLHMNVFPSSPAVLIPVQELISVFIFSSLSFLIHIFSCNAGRFSRGEYQDTSSLLGLLLNCSLLSTNR